MDTDRTAAVPVLPMLYLLNRVSMITVINTSSPSIRTICSALQKSATLSYDSTIISTSIYSRPTGDAGSRSTVLFTLL